MVNKTKFINELEKETQLRTEECLIINDVLENNFIIGRKNKQKIINATEAYQKNIEDGYIKETEPMPNFEGRLTKLFKKIFNELFFISWI